MKKLRFILLAAAMLTVFAVQMNAQGLGLRAGVNFQNINGKNAFGDQLSNDLITGYHFGLIGEAQIAPAFLFQSGLLYSVKGAKSTDDLLPGVNATTTVKTGYLEVPLHLVFKPMLGNGHIILGLGPYVAFGLNGKATYDIAGKEGDFKVKFQKTVDANDNEENFYMRRLDAGGNLFFGYEFAGGLSVQLNTQLGMIKVNPDYDDNDDDTKWNNTGFGVSAMYRIGPR